MAKSKSPEVPVDRRSAEARRGKDRRTENLSVNLERRQSDRREKVVRRRQIDPTTCERDYSDEEVVFMQALDEYKRKNGRMFPTCSEILEVLRGLGYVKVAPAPAPVTTADLLIPPTTLVSEETLSA